MGQTHSARGWDQGGRRCWDCGNSKQHALMQRTTQHRPFTCCLNCFSSQPSAEPAAKPVGMSDFAKLAVHLLAVQLQLPCGMLSSILGNPAYDIPAIDSAAHTTALYFLQIAATMGKYLGPQASVQVIRDLSEFLACSVWINTMRQSHHEPDRATVISYVTYHLTDVACCYIIVPAILQLQDITAAVTSSLN